MQQKRRLVKSEAAAELRAVREGEAAAHNAKCDTKEGEGG